MPAHDPATGATPTSRMVAIDLLRGLVMVLMVLDHTRDYFTDAAIDPTDLGRATPAQFLTRWVTHLCAPTFALLAGAGARLAGRRRSDPASMARFLLLRGLWLILLEQTIVKFGLFFRLNPGFLLGLVLWSLGGSFVLLSGLVALRVPARLIGLAGLAIVAGHNLLDALPPDAGLASRPLATLLLRPGAIVLPRGVVAIVGYPLLPWFGVVAAGYWLGGLYLPGSEPGRRRRTLTTLGLASLVCFAVLRAAGAYGEPRPWTTGPDPATAALSFLNVTKYPPSLQFLLMTLGPALLLLAAFDRGIGRLGRPLEVLGRVPLFFYVLQWYVIHGLALALAWARGEPTGWLFIETLPIQPPPTLAFGIPALLGWWLAVLILMYVPCALYDAYKRRHPGSAWLGYL